MVGSLSLTVDPSDDVIVLNDTKVSLHCVAMGDTDDITYYWYKDNNTLFDDHHVTIFDNGTLLINVTDYRRDNGSYHCEAIDRYDNNVTSNNSALLKIACEFPW